MSYKFDREIFSNKSWIKRLEPIIQQACDKVGITLEEGNDIIDEYIILLRNVLEDPRMISVFVPTLGAFKIELGPLRNRIKRSMIYHKKGSTPLYVVQGVIKKYWKIYKRKISEKYNSCAKTCRHWNSLSPEEVKNFDKSDLFTKLPDNYYKLDYSSWLKFIRSKPRFGKDERRLKAVIPVINSLIGRLRKIDKIDIDEKTLPAKGFKIPRGSGKLKADFYEKVVIMYSILTETFCFDTMTVLDEDIFLKNKNNHGFFI